MSRLGTSVSSLAWQCMTSSTKSSRITTCQFSSYVSPDSYPRITVPHKIAQNFEKKKLKKLDKKLAERRKKGRATGPLLISCSRKAYNFYEGQNSRDLDVASMVSSGWKNTRRVGDHFTLLPHGENPSFQVYDEEPETFNDLGLRPDLCLALAELGFDIPTHIQTRSIPSLLDGSNVALAAETGSGKTLAYLLPSIEWVLKKKEISDSHNQKYRNINSPNTIILTPNQELCHQVMSVAESLRPHADFTPFCIIGGQSLTGSFRQLKRFPMDILITSPGKLISLLNNRSIKGRNLQHIVLDESDTLLDDSFIEDTTTIFNKLKVTSVEHLPGEADSLLTGTQIVLSSATMPKNLGQALGNTLPIDEAERITTGALHRLMPHVTQKFIRINPDSKNDRLVTLVKSEESKKDQSSTLIFVRNNRTCHFVHRMLEEAGIDCLKLHGGLSREQRGGVMTKFMEGYCDYLVATDIASRGLDTVNVGHVINYDCPQFISDYIHRVGRVGRVGAKFPARVTSYVSQKWEVELVWKIEICARKGRELSDVNANIKHEMEAVRRYKERWELDLS